LPRASSRFSTTARELRLHGGYTLNGDCLIPKSDLGRRGDGGAGECKLPVRCSG
jgi:hypothetical protein